MNQSNKVQPHHLENAAYLYIRQSSMRQVVENVESTKRQYALRGRAILVRDRSYEAPGAVRITVGTREQTARLLAVLEEVLNP